MPALVGLDWLWTGAVTWRTRPLSLLAVAIACAAVAWLPWVGGLLTALILPLAYGGLVRSLDARSGDSIRAPLDALLDNNRWQKLAVLAAPLLALWLLGLILGWFFVVDTTAGAVAGSNLALARLGVGTILLPAIGLAAVVVALMLLFFAVPAVALRDVEPVQALREGWQTSVAQLPALLVLAGVVVLAVLLLSAVLFRLPGGWLIGSIGLALLVHPVLAAAMWAADHDLHDED